VENWLGGKNWAPARAAHVRRTADRDRFCSAHCYIQFSNPKYRSINRMQQWKATIRLGNGSQQVVYVTADNGQKAKYMIEAQYGKGSIIGIPTPA